MRERRPTSTSNFGVGRRESHDATAFYERFQPPELSTDDEVQPPKPVADPFVCGDARAMDELDDGSVALVVTSPPYFAGKHYEEELEKEGVPSSYIEYLELLHDVFAECVRKLEPGGRIAVNVANLGRKPYRSLVGRRHRDPAGPTRAAAPRRDHLAEGRGRERLVCVGIVSQPGEPRAARSHRARRDREQGPVRPSTQSEEAKQARGFPTSRR